MFDEEFAEAVELIARFIEAVGVLVIVLGIAFAFFRFARGARTLEAYGRVRKDLGRAILLGLEVLVAADIVATVVTEPTMEKVLVLGVIVLIRTFLSFSLEIELEGKLPWQQADDKVPAA